MNDKGSYSAVVGGVKLSSRTGLTYTKPSDHKMVQGAAVTFAGLSIEWTRVVGPGENKNAIQVTYFGLGAEYDFESDDLFLGILINVSATAVGSIEGTFKTGVVL